MEVQHRNLRTKSVVPHVKYKLDVWEKICKIVKMVQFFVTGVYSCPVLSVTHLLNEQYTVNKLDVFENKILILKYSTKIANTLKMKGDKSFKYAQL